MKRDQTGGAVRVEKISEVICSMIEAIEKTHCTVEEEMIAVSVFSEWLENEIPDEKRFPLANARARFLQLFPHFA